MNTRKTLKKAASRYQEKAKKKPFSMPVIVAELKRCMRLLEKGRNPKYAGYDITETDILATGFNVKTRMTQRHVKQRADQNEELIDVMLCAATALGFDYGLTGPTKDWRAMMSIAETQSLLMDYYAKTIKKLETKLNKPKPKP